jgi:carbamoyltransferase
VSGYEGGIGLEDVDYVVFYEKPFLKFERLLETYLAFAPRGFSSFRKAMPLWLKEKLFQKDLLIKELPRGGADKRIGERLLFTEHHFSHAASAFFPSPFEEAVVLTIDGVGEWATSTVAVGRGNELVGEYKVMGLAPYGEPRFKNLILDNIVDLKSDGTFRLDQSYFNYCTGVTMTNGRFSDLFGEPVRKPETDLLTQFHMDVAASIQAVTDEILLRLTRTLAREYGLHNLCLAGGVVLNCVANSKILRDGGSATSGFSQRPTTPGEPWAPRSLIPWQIRAGPISHRGLQGQVPP